MSDIFLCYYRGYLRSGWHSLLACSLVGSERDRQARCVTALIGPLPPLQLCGRSR